jgi:aryl-alcohol dehydrogenase-like predicted oxidoreductase
MLEMARQKSFHFNAVLSPSNVMDWSFRSLVHQLMPVALREGIAVQTMKPMGGKFILESQTVTPEECLQYALSQPTSVVIHGMDRMEYLEQSLEGVKHFKPLSERQIAALAGRPGRRR